MARFRTEIQAVARLQHPHIVQIHEVGEQDGRPYFSMEFADKAAYEGYNKHPKHVAFVRDRWDREVDRFMEIDYEPL